MFGLKSVCDSQSRTACQEGNPVKVTYHRPEQRATRGKARQKHSNETALPGQCNHPWKDDRSSEQGMSDDGFRWLHRHKGVSDCRDMSQLRRRSQRR